MTNEEINTVLFQPTDIPFQCTSKIIFMIITIIAALVSCRNIGPILPELTLLIDKGMAL